MEKKSTLDRLIFSLVMTIGFLTPTWLFLAGMFHTEAGMLFFGIAQALCIVALVSTLYSAWIKRR